jgi:hypothetical protein
MVILPKIPEMKNMHFSLNSIKGGGCYWEDPECCQGRPYTQGQRIHL